VTELLQPQQTVCPTNTNCVTDYTWTLTQAEYNGNNITNGTLIVVTDGVTVTAPVSQDYCHTVETIDNTNTGSIVTITSSDCTVTGSVHIGTNSVQYEAPGFVTAALAQQGSVGNQTYLWSN